MRLKVLSSLFLLLVLIAVYQATSIKTVCYHDGCTHGPDLAVRMNPRYYQCLKVARAVKTGISRQEFAKRFFINGGIRQEGSPEEYFVSGCSWGIKGGVMVKARFSSLGSKESGGSFAKANGSDILTTFSDPLWGEYFPD